MAELEPCPFCGGEEIERHPDEHVMMSCARCEASGPIVSFGRPMTPEENWNTRSDRTQLDELRARYDERLTDLQMLAFKWMDAHDKLKAGLPYELPKPADVPDTMAQLDKLRAALEPFAKCAEQLKNRTDFGDKVIVSVGQTVLTLDDFNQARKALGGTNG